MKLNVKNELKWGVLLCVAILFIVAGFEYIDYLADKNKLEDVDFIRKIFAYISIPVLLYVGFKSFFASSKND